MEWAYPFPSPSPLTKTSGNMAITPQRIAFMPLLPHASPKDVGTMKPTCQKGVLVVNILS